MSDTSLLLYPGVALASLIGSYLGAYFKRKGENLATHEDLDKLVAQVSAVTETTENIKAAISDDVWDRQRQWEMKRDAILDAIRAYADLESTLVKPNSWLSVSVKNPTDKTDAELSAAIQDFRSSRTSFRHAHLIANLAVGGQLSNAMSAYFLLTGTIAKDMTPQKSFLDSAKNKEFALAGNNVILSARQALGIKDAGDLPRFDDSN